MRQQARWITVLLLLAAPSRVAWGGDLGNLGLAAAAVGLFAAVASQDRPETFIVYGKGVSTEPAFATESFATPGSAMLAIFKYQEVLAARLKNHGLAFKVAGEKPTFCSPNGSNCWVDRDEDGKFDFNKTTSRGANITYTTEKLKVDLPADGYRYELLYQGAAGRILRLLYREYVNDMARPSFTQELSYDLAEPGLSTLLAFRDLRFEILQADNQGIRYKVSAEGDAWPESSGMP